MTLAELEAAGFVAVVQVDEDGEAYYSDPAEHLDEAMERVVRLAEHGPDVDGWGTFRLADGRTALQLCFREADLPSPI